ncbi:uncharacterized protein LOC111119614 [Crassostrea virginica]
MTFLSLYVVCVLAFIPKCRSLCSKPEIINFSPQGFSLGIGHTFKTFPTPSVFACMEMCISYPMCRSIDLNREIGECRLQVKSSVTDPGLLVSTPNTFHMDKEHFPQTLMDNVCQTLSCDNKTMCRGYSGCVPVLDGKTCGSPPSVPNAGAIPAGPFPVGHTHNYTCNVHYTPVHESYTTCQENGKWSNVLFRCQEECPVHHPDANLTNVKVTSTSIGTTLSYTCHWNKSMTLNSTCKADGTWTSSASICPTAPPDCFDTHDSCWYQFNFAYDTAFNGCPDGDRFVRRTKYSSAPFVGVVLCSPTRYKILLGANLTGTFLNVGDGDGQGEDLCELVGGLEMNAYLPGDYRNAPEMTGYARKYLGEEFQLQPIAGETTWRCNSWYQCAVQIPGTPEPDCMSATPLCWYSFNVWLDNSCNSCNACSGGQIFVKRTNYTSAPFLAVQLCSSTGYKLFLGSSLGGKFMHIADASGTGEDHCELVGGSELSASTGTVYMISSSYFGYRRHHVGEQFSLGSFNEFPRYYECGVPIPGTDIVV